ncbi:MAG: SDR family oxidoreductase [Deltaproteobacteria bacterium]
MNNQQDHWAVILGGSSGFGLATAHKLAATGMNLFIVHRDRRGAMRRIQPDFDALRAFGPRVVTCNADALDAERRQELVAQLGTELGDAGRVRLLLHSVAFGNLKLIAREVTQPDDTLAKLAESLGIDADSLGAEVEKLVDQGHDSLIDLAAAPEYPDHAVLEDEDFTRTVHAMGTSLVGWAREILEARLFADDARVIGLTSEGNEVAWKGYAAVAAAKVALESVSRSMAVELAPRGIRSNVVQPGVTDTAALQAIPGARHLRAHARRRNPFGRLTTPEDVANVIYLLTRDEAAWINGTVLRVDGGEHVSGGIG